MYASGLLDTSPNKKYTSKYFQNMEATMMLPKQAGYKNALLFFFFKRGSSFHGYILPKTNITRRKMVLHVGSGGLHPLKSWNLGEGQDPFVCTSLK